MAVITATEYKTWAGIGGTDLDTWLAAVIAQAQDFAERWCDRNFESAERTEYYDGHGGETIQLRSTPVTAISSVSYISGVSSGAATYTAYATDSYWVDSTGILSRYSAFDAWDEAGDRAIWPEGVRNIKVVYTGGWSTIPEGLKLAVFHLIDYLKDLRGKSPGLQSESMGNYSYTRAQMSATVTDDLMYQFGFGPFRAVTA